MGGPAHGYWAVGRDAGGLRQWETGSLSAFPGAGWFFLAVGFLTLASSLMAQAFQEADLAGASKEALEASQPFYPMDLEPLQEGEVKQWSKDAVILLAGE